MRVFTQAQKRTGKIALLLMTLIAILAFSFGNRMTTMAQDRENRWAGTVTDSSGDPVDATININGVQVEADGNGEFELQVPNPEDSRYVINVDKLGYVPISLIHRGRAMQYMDLRLQKPQRFDISPHEPIEVEDQRGTQISIEPGSLVDSDGNPAERPIQLLMYTYDLTSEEMVGDMSGINRDGELVALESAGAFYAEFIDEEGNGYNLAEGAEARIAIPADRTAEFPDAMPLWSYDTKSGLWVEESKAVLRGERYVGIVTHFSVWNFDVEKRAPACIRVTVDFSSLPPGSAIQVKAKLLSPTRVRYLNLTQTNNVLVNLPAYTNVEFYKPVNATMPFATVNTGAPWGGQWAPPYPYRACNGSVKIVGPPTITPTPTSTPTPIPPPSDLGDAPDSTNNFGTLTMTTLSGVPANYPVVFNDPFGIPGPIHWDSMADAWLGRSVDGEIDADLPPGLPTNIDPPSNIANEDDLPGTTGIIAPTFALPFCGMTTFQYEVTVVGGPQPRYTNAWIDFNDDGDWEDIIPCGGGLWVSEWIVANQITTLGPGVHTLTTPAFNAMQPGGSPVWMRLMLSEGPAVNVPVPSGADGRGPLGGYDFGETEDYLTDGINIKP